MYGRRLFPSAARSTRGRFARHCSRLETSPLAPVLPDILCRVYFSFLSSVTHWFVKILSKCCNYLLDIRIERDPNEGETRSSFSWFFKKCLRSFFAFFDFGPTRNIVWNVNYASKAAFIFFYSVRYQFVGYFYFIPHARIYLEFMLFNILYLWTLWNLFILECLVQYLLKIKCVELVVKKLF